MSWDVILLKEKFDLDAVPKDYNPQPLGNREHIISKLLSIIPDIDYSDKSWGMLDTSEYLIEFNTGRKDEVESIMLHIRGGGDPIVLIKLICETFDWAALDCSEGDFIDLGNLSPYSWEQFQKYRDRVLDNGS